jgi:prevent-host-death family protein
MTRAARGRTPRREVGVRELKTNAARILRQVRDGRASYVLTHRGRAVGIILPLDPDEHEPAMDDIDSGPAWAAFVAAGRRLESRFRAGTGGVQTLSEMRR